MKPLVSIMIFATSLSCSSPSPHTTDILKEMKLDSGPGGAVAVIRDGRVVFSETFGSAEVHKATPITEVTNFRLASVTKQFTAMAVMILVERGSVAIEQPVTSFFPEISPAARRITVGQLLTHTSGIVDYEDLIPDTATVPVLDRDVLQLVAPVDSTYFTPGTSYRYSNTGYALLALIVELASGKSFAEFLQREIFRPLGMNATVAFEKGISTVSNRAFGSSPDPNQTGAFVETDQSMTSSVLGDGGIYSSIHDLKKWDIGLREGRLVADTTFQKMISPHVAIEEGTRWYGFGWYIRLVDKATVSYHGGSTVGFRTCILRIPSRSSAVIALFNRSDAEAERIAWKLAENFELLPSEDSR